MPRQNSAASLPSRCPFRSLRRNGLTLSGSDDWATRCSTSKILEDLGRVIVLQAVPFPQLNQIVLFHLCSGYGLGVEPRARFARGAPSPASPSFARGTRRFKVCLDRGVITQLRFSQAMQDSHRTALRAREAKT